MVTRAKYVFTQAHIENVRKAVRKNRKEHGNIDMASRSPNVCTLDEQKRIERDYHKKLTDFFTNLSCSIFWRKLKDDSEVSINMAIKNLEYRLGRNLDDKFGDVSLLLVQYVKNVTETNIQFPYPKVMSLTMLNYPQRVDELISLKKQAIKDLKEILEGKN